MLASPTTLHLVLLATLLTLPALPTIARSAAFSGANNSPLTETDIQQLSGVRDGNRLYSGDIIYNIDDLRSSGFTSNLWPSGVLVYDFSAEVTQDQISRFEQSCNAWTASTPLQCVRRTTQNDYILVRNHSGEGCSKGSVSCSYVGRIGGVQDLTVHVDHWNIPSIIRHEIGHAIGMRHEQSRPDRDNYVLVRYHNIKSEAVSNFETDSNLALLNEYDLDSIMHYSNCQFSIHGGTCSLQRPDLQTIEPRACGRDRVGGDAITTLDIQGVQRAYAQSIYALYDVQRDRSCGVHTLSSVQTAYLCGNDCAYASEITFGKIEQLSGQDCGSFHVERDWNGLCRGVNKEVVKHWDDLDEFSCWKGPVLTNRYEWWVDCGCSIQLLPAACVHDNLKPRPERIDQLLSTGSDNEKAAALYLKRMEGWKKEKAIDDLVSKYSLNLIIKNLLREGFDDQIVYLLCNMRIAIEAKKLSDKNYKISNGVFRRLAVSAGLVLPN